MDKLHELGDNPMDSVAETALGKQIRLAALQMDVSTALIAGGTERAMLGQCANALVHHLDAAFRRYHEVQAR